MGSGYTLFSGAVVSVLLPYNQVAVYCIVKIDDLYYMLFVHKELLVKLYVNILVINMFIRMNIK